ncbi:MAG: WG repeat-containing protein [Prevotellaceae bacterium]|jgi:hypothetical protein|nr:WG repeat-containing protein [Prevotellaceae bacterium]
MKKQGVIIVVFLLLVTASWAQRQIIVPYYDRATDLYGYRDSALNMIAIPAKYGFADRYSCGIARVMLDGKWGFIAFSGKEITPPIYEDALNMTDSLAAVKLGGKWGYINRSGQTVIAHQYDLATPFSEDRAAVFHDGFWGFINQLGKEGIEAIFGYDENVYPVFRGGLANVKFRDFWGYIDRNGKIAIAFQYDYTLPFDGDIAAVQKDGKWGFVNRAGKEIIPLQYETAGTLPIIRENLIALSFDEKYGFLDRTGKIAVPFMYDYAANFENGTALVRLGDTQFYIDKQGEIVKK